jgi:protein arginine kinase activator
LGCDECYKAFADKLEPLIKRVQGFDRHTGKVLKRASGPLRLKKEIEQLKNSLQQALVEEAYEEAARLRDLIRELEKEYREGGGAQ